MRGEAKHDGFEFNLVDRFLRIDYDAGISEKQGERNSCF